MRRTPETQAAYEARKRTPNYAETFNYLTDDHTLVQDFTHWKIIQNDFPYDAILSDHHLLIPKRAFSRLHEATDAEQAEYQEILHTLETQGFYESMMINFPKKRSVVKHVHIHLLNWKP